MNTILTSERLILTPVSDIHLPALLKIYTNKANLKLIPKGNRLATSEELRKKYQNLKHSDRFGVFAISLKETNQIIGEAGLFDSFNKQDNVELGYIIDEPFWNKGYGTEVCSLITNHCLKTGFTTITTRMYANNFASVKISERCGLKRVNTFRDKEGRQAYEYRLVALI